MSRRPDGVSIFAKVSRPPLAATSLGRVGPGTTSCMRRRLGRRPSFLRMYFKLATSNDWISSGARRVYSCAAKVARNRCSSGKPTLAK